MAPATTIVELVASHEECDGTWTFLFTRPPAYAFIAGQYFRLTLETREGTQTKSFTHCDAPGDEHARLLTRATGSPFKDALLALEPGDTVSVAGPFGRLTVPAGVRRAAFLVGGVGVTPAASIIRDAVDRGSDLEFLVFYGNTDEGCIPLHEEFAAYSARDPRVRVVDVLWKPGDDWTGERGLITAGIVRRHCDPLDGWHWFASGPPAMTDAMRAVVTELGVPATSVSFEEFEGYR
jgi:glycine betaine catabolism B